jgi:putative transposase
MVRMARLIIPDVPHHVTQRGNGRQRTFFSYGDYALCRDLLAHHCEAAEVEVWAWCLMPNRVHLILVPTDVDGIRRALSKVHRIYAGGIHARQKKTGHFWQGRFGAVAPDEGHLLNAFRHVGLNPVRARLAKAAVEWPWASTRAYVGGSADGVTIKAPMQSRYPDMAALFESPAIYDLEAFERLRMAESIGRPLGDKAFLESIEDKTSRQLSARKRGLKAKEKFSALSP